MGAEGERPRGGGVLVNGPRKRGRGPLGGGVLLTHRMSFSMVWSRERGRAESGSPLERMEAAEDDSIPCTSVYCPALTPAASSFSVAAARTLRGMLNARGGNVRGGPPRTGSSRWSASAEYLGYTRGTPRKRIGYGWMHCQAV